MSTSSINFDAAFSNADLKDAAEALRQWLTAHASLSYFTFDQVCVELAHRVPLDQLNRVLVRLVAAGELVVSYRVKFDEGEYSEEEYTSLDEIPACVFDSAFEPISVSDEIKVPSYAPAR